MIDYIIGNNGVLVTSPSPSQVGVTGSIRWNGSMQRMEVMDGLNWLPIYNGTATIDLTPEIQELVNWAKKKRIEEGLLNELCKQHPGLQDAKEKFEIMLALTKNAPASA
jgi:hypothetical protein